MTFYQIVSPGKTLAFLLPLFRHIADQDPLEENDGPIAIIMTPTRWATSNFDSLKLIIFFRELCLQIGKECRKFIKAVGGARVVCVYGRSIILSSNIILGPQSHNL